LQEFVTAVRQLANRAYPALPKDHIRRKTGKAFTDEAEDPAMKIQLHLGREKTVNEALLQAVLLAARSQKRVSSLSVGADDPNQVKRHDDQHAGAVGSWATYGVNAPMEGRQETMTGAGNTTKDLRETHRNC
jgi:hypothetical protein